MNGLPGIGVGIAGLVIVAIILYFSLRAQMTPFDVDDTRHIILQNRRDGMERDVHNKQVNVINNDIRNAGAQRVPHSAVFNGRYLPYGYVPPELAEIIDGDVGYIARHRGVLPSDFVEDW